MQIKINEQETYEIQIPDVVNSKELLMLLDRLKKISALTKEENELKSLKSTVHKKNNGAHLIQRQEQCVDILNTYNTQGLESAFVLARKYGYGGSKHNIYQLFSSIRKRYGK